jgi:hypothetical protein
MAQNGLVDDVSRWFGFVEARDKTSHTYDKKVAGEVFAVIPEFIVEADKLRKKLEQP